MCDEHSGFNVGDLIRVIHICDPEEYIFRPYGFPYGKVGLVTRLTYFDDETEFEFDIDPGLYPIDYDFRAYYSDLIEILVEGRRYWVFLDEIEKVNQKESE